MKPTFITVTPTLDTSAYASGDYMAKGSIAGALEKNSGIAKLVSLQVLDEAKQKVAFDILFFDADPTVASAVNAAIDISDAEMAKYLGFVAVAAGDYLTDLAGSSIATKSNIQLMLEGSESSPSTSLYYVLVTRGAPTYAASSLKIKFGFERY